MDGATRLKIVTDEIQVQAGVRQCTSATKGIGIFAVGAVVTLVLATIVGMQEDVDETLRGVGCAAIGVIGLAASLHFACKYGIREEMEASNMIKDAPTYAAAKIAAEDAEQARRREEREVRNLDARAKG